MATYLIDYENVYIEGLTGLERLSQRDEVVIFYTQNRCGLTFELHQRLISCKAKLRLMEVTAEEHGEKRTGSPAFHVYRLPGGQPSQGTAVYHQQGHRLRPGSDVL